jgi:UDP-glucose 4-epimerase
MKVIVTGGAGFIGSHTVDQLVKQGHQVTVIDQKVKNPFHNEQTLYEAVNILDKQSLTRIFQSFKPDAVIHLAAQVDVQTSILQPDLDIDINLKGTINILEQCRSIGAKVIFASSAAVYGIPQQLPITENHETMPLSIYGLSKLSAERYIQLYHHLYGVEYCIFRYANVYGPRQDSTGEGGVVSIFVDQLLKQQIPTIYGDGTQTRDFVFVGDVAQANVLALEGSSNAILNVGNTRETSVFELFQLLTEMMDIVIDPKYAEGKKGEISRSVLESAQLQACLNWKGETNLTEGLRETIQFFQNEAKNMR